MPLYRECFGKAIGEDFGGGDQFNIYYILLNFLSRSDITLLHHKTVACLFFVVGEVIDKHHFLCSPLQASQAL